MDYETGEVIEQETTTYCCLGVACDIFRKNTKVGEWDYGGLKIGKKCFNGYLPEDVMNYFGFAGQDPVLLKNGSADDCEGTAVDLNDKREWSFKKIATAIERKFLK